MTGLILRGVGSFYTVLAEEAEYTCKARGKLRLDGTAPLPGDRVEFALDEREQGYILSILPRRSILVRPAVANVDKLIIVAAASAPKPDLLLVDKLLLYCERAGITPVIVLNKTDEAEEDFLSQYAGAGCRLIRASAKTGAGTEELKSEIAGNICCFAGQSAVGKSSLVNALLPGMELKTGDISHKTERGKHTTRHAELFRALGGAVVDTPGFSLLDTEEMEPWELSKLYPEMREALVNCRFSECLHDSEPDCAVKPLIGGVLDKERYARYLMILNELKEKRRHRYD